MADGTPKKKEPTASEAMFFFSIVKYTRNKADVDWKLVAEEQGFKNAEVAKVRFGQVKRKLGLTTDTSGSPAKSVTPKKTGGTASGPVTPTKISKATGRTGAKGRGYGKVKKEEPTEEPAEDAEDAEEEPTFQPVTPIKDEDEEEDADKLDSNTKQ